MMPGMTTTTITEGLPMTATANLHDYQTGEYLRPATADELAASIAAAEEDGGAGVIKVDGRAVYAVEAMTRIKANHQLEVVDVDENDYRKTPASIWPQDWNDQADTGDGSMLITEYIDWILENNDGFVTVVDEREAAGCGDWLVTFRDDRNDKVWKQALRPVALDEDGREVASQ